MFPTQVGWFYYIELYYYPLMPNETLRVAPYQWSVPIYDVDTRRRSFQTADPLDLSQLDKPK